MKVLQNNELVRLSGWQLPTIVKVIWEYMGRKVPDPEFPFVCYAGAVITASKELHASRMREAAAAVILEPGEVVDMDGYFYEVIVLPGQEEIPRTCDPIHFKRVSPPEIEPNQFKRHLLKPLAEYFTERVLEAPVDDPIWKWAAPLPKMDTHYAAEYAADRGLQLANAVLTGQMPYLVRQLFDEMKALHSES